MQFTDKTLFGHEEATSKSTTSRLAGAGTARRHHHPSSVWLIKLPLVLKMALLGILEGLFNNAAQLSFLLVFPFE